jgi:hypothetical protein
MSYPVDRLIEAEREMRAIFGGAEINEKQIVDNVLLMITEDIHQLMNDTKPISYEDTLKPIPKQTGGVR